MRTIIIGGGATGNSTAARLRRLDKDMEIIVLEKTGETSIANCGLPYYCSGVISERDKMIVSSAQKMRKLFDIDIRLNTEVVKLNYDKLVLALGASPIIPTIDGVKGNKKIFTVRTLNDADRIKKYIQETNSKKAVVIGGGFIGVEMAENFAHMGLDTKLVELSSQILAPIDYDIAVFAQNIMRDNGVELILSDGVKKFEENSIELASGKKIDYDVTIMAIGVRAETTLAKDCGLEVNRGL